MCDTELKYPLKKRKQGNYIIELKDIIDDRLFRQKKVQTAFFPARGEICEGVSTCQRNTL